MASAPAPASKPKVTYFNYDGGRGEVIRIALFIAGVDFIDDRIDFTTWPARKPQTPYGALPLLEWEGKQLAQSNAILRFIGRKFDLYPTDLFEAARGDEFMDAVEDIAMKFAPTMQIPAGPERLAKRKEIAEGPLVHYLRRFEEELKRAGGKHFVAGKLTVVDLKIWGLIRWLCSGQLDGIDASVVAPFPALTAFRAALESHPKIAEWLASRKKP